MKTGFKKKRKKEKTQGNALVHGNHTPMYPIHIITPALRNPGVTLVCRLYEVIIQDFAQGSGSPENILSLESFLLSKANLSFNSLLICSPSLLIFSMYS